MRSRFSLFLPVWLAASMLVAVTVLFVVVQEPASARKRSPWQRDYQSEVTVYNMIGEANKLIEANQYVQAKELLLRATSMDPNSNSVNVHHNLAIVYRHLGNSEGAIRESQIALRFDPDSAPVAFEIALAYEDMGQFDNAIAWAQRCAQMKADKRTRDEAAKLVGELQERREQQARFDPHLPDYLDQLSSENDAHPWLAEKLPIRVFLDPSLGMPGFRPPFHNIALDCLNIWARASGNRLGYIFVDDREQADLTFSWTTSLVPSKKTRFHERVGLTEPDLVEIDGGGWKIEHVTVSLATLDPHTGQPIADEQMKSTCLHECGHALGLVGHSNNTADIMFFSENSRQLPALTKRDKATIARLYVDYPQLSPIVNQPTSSFSRQPSEYQIPDNVGQQPAAASSPREINGAYPQQMNPDYRQQMAPGYRQQMNPGSY